MVPDYLTIAEAARLIEKRELSPVELVDSRLDRIARLDGQLHSFIRVLADAARHEARATEAEIAAGKYRGPLHGIPIGLKDIYETAGVATTGHSKVMQDHVPQKDAFSVRGCVRPALSSLASSRPTSSPLAGPRSICPGRRRAIRGT